MNFLQVHLHVSSDIWRTCAAQECMSCWQQMPDPQINNDQAGGKKPLQNRACSCIRPVMQQASSAGTGRVGCSAQVLQVHRSPACPLHRPAPAPALHHRGVGPGPPKARFLGLRPTEGEREPAQKCISSNVLRGDSCPSLIRPIYAS